MPTLRNYATASQISALTGIDVNLLTDNLISRAEFAIDRYCADFYKGAFKRGFTGQVTTTAVATTTTTLTLPLNQTNIADYYKYCVIRLSNGVELPVMSSANNIITIPLTSGLTGSYGALIYQLGKFPRISDNKFIIADLVQAIAFQLDFMINNSRNRNGISSTLNNVTKQSESIGENYSYTKVTAGGGQDTMASRISPLARDIIEALGMNYQACV